MRNTVFIIFAILVLGFIRLSTGTATSQLPRSDKRIASTRAASFSFLSCFGGSDVDDCDDITVDADGYLYLACHSLSNDFPGSKSRDNSHDADRMDAYVSKIDPVAGKVIYTTRLGGNKWDGAIRIEVDQQGNAYVAGFTESSNFPTTSNAFRRAYIGGKSDAFLVKLKADGAIEYSSFFGGSDADQGNGLALDKAGNVYLAGTTWSDDLPGIETGSANKNSGKGDGFVAVWKLDQPSTLRVKYVGGREVEKITGIALDNSGSLFISGFTQSPDFPLQAALQKKLYGKHDAFLTKLKLTDLSYGFSTFIGGAGEDQAWGVAVDAAGRPYLAGGSDSTDFPTTTNAIQRSYKGETDAFVTKFDAMGTRILYSTYLGGSGYDSSGYDGGDITIDRDGNAWVVGMTHSPDFPMANAIQTVYGGGEREGYRDGDGFVSVINPIGSALLLSSYVGGSERDILEGAAPAPGGGVWATGLTGSRNLQTIGSLQKAHNGGLFDILLIKVPVPERRSMPR
jgi:Beta-propeller repeat